MRLDFILMAVMLSLAATALILPFSVSLEISVPGAVGKEEDIPKYGKAVGTGTLIIGISLVLGFIVSFWSEEIMGFIILPAVIVGLGFMLYGQIKYNKGIF